MNASFPLPAFLAAAALVFSGCDWMPGKPTENDRWKPASANLDFASLYAQNCLACHGDGAQVAASIPMNHPVYLNIIPREEMLKVTSDGVPGSSMPGFSNKSGGPLTDEQIEVIVDGIYKWKTESIPGPLPAYSAPPGDAARGAAAFGVYCASCHGVGGTGGPDGGSVVEPAYLGLVSDQYLRTVTIAGRPDLGMPDWRNYVPGQPMSDQEIADVVAWLISHRKTPTPQPSDIGLQ